MMLDCSTTSGEPTQPEGKTINNTIFSFHVYLIIAVTSLPLEAPKDVNALPTAVLARQQGMLGHMQRQYKFLTYKGFSHSPNIDNQKKQV